MRVALALAALLAAVPCHGRSRPRPADDVSPTTNPSQDADYTAKYTLPEGFLFGVGTGSYQTEGAWDQDGKGLNVFDYTYHLENATNNGDVACNSYNRYAEDVALAAELKVDVYRISISWARIFPDGNITNINQKGVDHYHDVIDEIIKQGMKPMVTIYHFDHPQALETEFEGWLSEKMVDKFAEYADFIFSEYGDKVNHWVTINEPNMHCMLVFGGGLPPGTHKLLRSDEAANSYTCIHHEILAHSKAYQLYQDKYKATQKGIVGIGGVTFFSRPNSTEYDDIRAAQRSNMFDIGLLLHPLVYGDYPAVVRATLKEAGTDANLPTFTDAQKLALPGTIDFVGVNAYFGQRVADRNKKNQGSGGGGGGGGGGPGGGGGGPGGDGGGGGGGPGNGVLGEDGGGGGGSGGNWRSDANVTICNDMVPSSGGSFGDAFTTINAWILRDVSLWIRDYFGEVGIFITENGMGNTKEDLDDYDTRAVYHSAYLRELVRTANQDNVNILGYTVWSFLDDFEWGGGFERRFGMVHVDFDSGSLNRTLKTSSSFFKQLMLERVVPLVEASDSGDAGGGGDSGGGGGGGGGGSGGGGDSGGGGSGGGGDSGGGGSGGGGDSGGGGSGGGGDSGGGSAGSHAVAAAPLLLLFLFVINAVL